MPTISALTFRMEARLSTSSMSINTRISSSSTISCIFANRPEISFPLSLKYLLKRLCALISISCPPCGNLEYEISFSSHPQVLSVQYPSLGYHTCAVIVLIIFGPGHGRERSSLYLGDHEEGLPCRNGQTIVWLLGFEISMINPNCSNYSLIAM